MFPIIEKLGGWVEAEKVLGAKGLTFTEHARKKWQAPDRGQLPRDVAITLGAEASRRGITFVEEDFSFIRQAAA